MKKFITEYLNMKEIQKLTTQGIEAIFTGWRENNGTEYVYEVRYRYCQVPGKTHTCRIFDMIKTSDTTFVCQTCKKTHDRKSFEDLKKKTPSRICHCGGTEKLMKLHVPYPVSGYENRPVFYTCLYCGGKYMYHRFICENNDCKNYCDITEVYCAECRQNMRKA